MGSARAAWRAPPLTPSSTPSQHSEKHDSCFVHVTRPGSTTAHSFAIFLKWKFNCHFSASHACDSLYVTFHILNYPRLKLEKESYKCTIEAHLFSKLAATASAQDTCCDQFLGVATPRVILDLQVFLGLFFDRVSNHMVQTISCQTKALHHQVISPTVSCPQT